MKHVLRILLLSSALLVAGCNTFSPNTYNSDTMQHPQRTERAVIQSVRPIDVNDPRLGVGTAVGAVAGAVAGAQIGEGKGSVLAALGGAAVGAVAGTAAEYEMTKTNAFEYILQKPNGELVTLAQKDDKPLAVGSPVFIVYGQQSRIIPDIGTNVAPAVVTQPK